VWLSSHLCLLQSLADARIYLVEPGPCSLWVQVLALKRWRLSVTVAAPRSAHASGLAQATQGNAVQWWAHRGAVVWRVRRSSLVQMGQPLGALAWMKSHRRCE
jgi:hypothetical protein